MVWPQMPGYMLEWTPKHGCGQRDEGEHDTDTSWIDAVMTDANTSSHLSFMSLKSNQREIKLQVLNLLCRGCALLVPSDHNNARSYLV